MDRAAIDGPLEDKYGSALRILGIFLDDDRRANAREEFIHRESIVSESVVAVLGYPNVPGCDQGGELLPEARHHALSGISVFPHNARDQWLAQGPATPQDDAESIASRGSSKPLRGRLLPAP